MCVTLCSSALEQPTDKFDTVLELLQIGDEDPTIKNPNFSSQESGMSFMSPKGHLWKARPIFVSFLATEECNTWNCLYFGGQIHWCIWKYSWMKFLESGTFSFSQEGMVRNIITDRLYFSQFVNYKRVYYIKLCLLWMTKSLVGSKALIDIIMESGISFMDQEETW